MKRSTADNTVSFNTWHHGGNMMGLLALAMHISIKTVLSLHIKLLKMKPAPLGQMTRNPLLLVTSRTEQQHSTASLMR